MQEMTVLCISVVSLNSNISIDFLATQIEQKVANMSEKVQRTFINKGLRSMIKNTGPELSSVEINFSISMDLNCSKIS